MYWICDESTLLMFGMGWSKNDDGTFTPTKDDREKHPNHWPEKVVALFDAKKKYTLEEAWALIHRHRQMLLTPKERLTNFVAFCVGQGMYPWSCGDCCGGVNFYDQFDNRVIHFDHIEFDFKAKVVRATLYTDNKHENVEVPLR